MVFNVLCSHYVSVVHNAEAQRRCKRKRATEAGKKAGICEIASTNPYNCFAYFSCNLPINMPVCLHEDETKRNAVRVN